MYFCSIPALLHSVYRFKTVVCVGHHLVLSKNKSRASLKIPRTTSFLGFICFTRTYSRNTVGFLMTERLSNVPPSPHTEWATLYAVHSINRGWGGGWGGGYIRKSFPVRFYDDRQCNRSPVFFLYQIFHSFRSGFQKPTMAPIRAQYLSKKSSAFWVISSIV